jgi:hypothetical protein
LPAAPLAYFPWIIVAVVAAAAVWGNSLKRKNSPVLYRIGAVLFMEAEATPHLEDIMSMPEGTTLKH